MLVKVSDKSKQLLVQSSIIASLLMLPPMRDSEYDEIKYIVEYLGGHWREKYKGFIFDADLGTVQKKLAHMLCIDSFKLSDDAVFKIKNQFYPTPDWLARQMVELGDIKKTDIALEPSAGQGAILKYIADKTKHYFSVENNKENAAYLRQLGFRVNLTSFENYYTKVKHGFDKIIMNPPFANKMDIKHTVLAYNLLNPNGRLISLIAENSIYYERAITHKFNNFLKTHNATITEIPHGSFKESGTNVDVIMIIIDKTHSETVDVLNWD